MSGAIDTTPTRLPLPPDPGDGRAGGSDAAVAWTRTHLGDLAAPVPGGAPVASGRFRGGQGAADAALASLDLAGYAATRSEVLPVSARGATGLSPYIRHGLIDLPTLWRIAADAPARDRDKYRDELLWQEYARHVYARLGSATRMPLRHALTMTTGSAYDPWTAARDDGMACMEVVLDELDRDGWLVNQTRMWVASHWAVRGGADWRDGEDRLYRELLDGSRAANRLGWQWTVGTGTGRPYGLSRSQVERRAPALCGTCPLRRDCPISDWPEDPVLVPVEPDPRLRHDPDPAATAGPASTERAPDAPAPEAVWLTAESLGDGDPALTAHPSLPVVFVFDAPLLARLQLHPRRLVFLAETLGDLAARRDVEVWRGDVVATLGSGSGRAASRPLAATFGPVPGWRRRAALLPVVERHPWPWLRRPDGGKVSSFSAWRGTGRARGRGSEVGDGDARAR
jgi:deoxyribodipyrimidine photo-lyase